MMTRSAGIVSLSVSMTKPRPCRRTAVTASPARRAMFGRASAKRSTSTTLLAAFESGYTRPPGSVTVMSPCAANQSSAAAGGKAASAGAAKSGCAPW